MSDLMINSFLEVDGRELSNGARTIQYLRNGLGSDKWQIGDGCTCWVLTAEECPTASGPEQCFRSPALDPAPWYDPDVPESGDFLGAIIRDVRPWFDGLAGRTVTAKSSGLGGASVGPQWQVPRPLHTNMLLIASSCGGMEYGRRWVQQILLGLCDPCQLSIARIRSFCPDVGLYEPGEWFVYDVGLTAGMTNLLEQDAFGQASFEGGDDGCCDFMEADLVLTAGNPYLYKRPELCIEASLNPEGCATDCLDFCHWFSDAPPAVVCQVNPPKIGTLGTVVTIEAGSGVSDVTVTTLLDCDDPSSVSGALNVPFLPAGSFLTIDSALRVLTYTSPEGVTSDGTPYIILPPGRGVPWLEIGECNEAQCVTAQLGRICDSDCTARVSISTQLREG